MVSTPSHLPLSPSQVFHIPQRRALVSWYRARSRATLACLRAIRRAAQSRRPGLTAREGGGGTQTAPARAFSPRLRCGRGTAPQMLVAPSSPREGGEETRTAAAYSPSPPLGAERAGVRWGRSLPPCAAERTHRARLRGCHEGRDRGLPGSNCDRDVMVALEASAGRAPAMVWHDEQALPACDLIVLPGGFATATTCARAPWRRARR